MKIVSWNINGYRSIVGQNPSKKFDTVSKDNKLFAYIEREKPDIICLQETKADEDQIFPELRAPEGYEYFYHSCRRKKGYSGVATFTKLKPDSHVREIGISKFDEEGRIIGLDLGEFVLLNVYFPNGTSGRERVDYKLEFYDAFFAYVNTLRKKGRKVIICGDYNTAHTEIDLARPKENAQTSGFLPEERVKLDFLKENGYVDSFRAFNPDPHHYTWWSQRGRARENNVGWRIDYHFVTDNLMGSVKNSFHQAHEQGSDHCPIVLELDL